MEDLKIAHEVRVDEFSVGKLIQNQNAFTGPRYGNCKMRAVVWMIQENLRMSKQYVVDNYLMFPVNLCYFLFLLTQEECWAAPEIRSLIHEYAWYIGKHFCQFPYTFFVTIFWNAQFKGCACYWTSSGASKHGTTRSWDCVVIEITTQSQLRDFYEVRQSDIHSFRTEKRILKNFGADQQRLQISELHFDNLPYSTNVFVLENKIQDWGMLLSKFPYGSDAMDQISKGS